MTPLNKQHKQKEHLPPFRYSSLFHQWRAAALAYNPETTRRASEAHARMIERLFGALDPWFYGPRKETT